MIPHFGSIALLRNQQYERYLPSAFDESMSLVQKVNLVIEHLNVSLDQMNILQDLTVDSLNEQTTEITNLLLSFETLKEWLENDGLSERVSVVLNGWFDSGKLGEIINGEVFDKKSGIIVSEVEPIENNTTMFWYHQTSFSQDNSTSGGTIISNTEPDDTSITWYEPI